MRDTETEAETAGKGMRDTETEAETAGKGMRTLTLMQTQCATLIFATQNIDL